MKKIYCIVILLFVTLSVSAQQPLLIPDTITGDTVNLNLQTGSVNFHAGTPTLTNGVNGNILGPTIILNRGTHVNINVHNSLPDTATLHWHGLHVSPPNDGGLWSPFAPATTWSIDFDVLDWAGTYWYHPHMHMHTNEQVQKGISGFIIVRDSIEKAITLPRTYGVDDFPMVIQTKAFDANNQIVVMTNLDTALMVNATIKPYLNLPAQVVRLRLLNGASQRTFNLGFTGNMTFYQIGSDGGLLSNTVPLTRLRLAPGERAEILIDLSLNNGQSLDLMNFGSELPNGVYGATHPGMMMMQTLPDYSSNPLNGGNYTVVHLNVGPATAANPVTTIPTTLVCHNPWPESSANITRQLTITSMGMGMNSIEGPFVFNGMMFDMMMINYYIPLNNTEIWTIWNHSQIAHPFHIHDVQFYVLDDNGAPPAANLQGRKDVILVLPMHTVRFITKFEDFADEDIPYMYHCHILTHEDDGMMGQFIVSSQLTDVVDLHTRNNFNVYPNPMMKDQNLTITSDVPVKQVSVINMVGQEIYNASVNTNIVELGPVLEKGIYLIKISTDKETTTKKVVVD